MAMEYTRVDTKKLTASVETARKHLEAAYAALEDLGVILTDDARASMVKPGEEVLEPLAKVVENLRGDDFKGLRALTELDVPAVLEDVANVKALAPLVPVLDKLAQITADSGRTWTAEAYTAVLASYNVAKVQAKTNGKIEQAIAPLTEHLARGKRRKPA